MRYLLLLLSFSILLPLGAQQEVIKNFAAELRVNTDGSIEVTENITVVANGDQIKRGITRALHRKPIGEDAATSRFDYEVISVLRDGKKEDFHTKSENDYRVLYVGSKKVILDPGPYSYTIKYRSDNQVYFLEGIDEVRWPLIGTDSKLPTEKASVKVVFEPGVQLLNSACYTGKDGSRDADCSLSQNDNEVTFTSSRALAPGEGMTVSTAAPRGSIMRPTPPPPPTPLQEKGTIWASLLGLLAALYYGYTTWQKYGVDPIGPEVRPQFAPPDGLSPASVAYLHNGYPSQQQVTASITALAIGGYVDVIEEERSGLFTSKEIFILRPTGKIPAAEALPAEQQVLYDELLRGDDIELDGKYNKELNAATTKHSESLSDQHKDFLKQGQNGWKVMPILGIWAGVAAIGGFYVRYSDNLGFGLFIGSLILLPIAAGFFVWLIQQPSLEKVTLLGKIKGLNQYLKLSEKKRRQLLNVPEMTEAHFQELLPYAIALGRENNWAADLSADWVNSSQRQGRRHMPWFLPGFGHSMNTAYAGTAHHAASGGGGGSSFSGGGGSVGGGGGTGGW